MWVPGLTEEQEIRLCTYVSSLSDLPFLILDCRLKQLALLLTNAYNDYCSLAYRIIDQRRLGNVCSHAGRAAHDRSAKISLTSTAFEGNIGSPEESYTIFNFAHKLKIPIVRPSSY